MSPGRNHAREKTPGRTVRGNRATASKGRRARAEIVEALVGAKVPCGRDNTRVIEVLGREGAEAIVDALEAAGLRIVRSRSRRRSSSSA